METKKDPQKIAIEAYNYPLPDERIAKFPMERRDESKLLLYNHGAISHTTFHQISDYIDEGELLVCNNTRVIQARMLFHKETGARIEIFCLEPIEPADYAMVFQTNTHCTWKCMIGNAKKWKEGTALHKEVVAGDRKTVFSALRISTEGNTHLVEFSWDNPQVNFADILDNFGVLPIPPYLHRETVDRDKVTYQTVYSKIKGSVAAPTAGLHFTEAVFESLRKKNIRCEEVTLHVGAGTFQPVKSDTIGEHEMHTEFITVRREVIEQIKQRGRVIAIGTTSVRTLESLYYIGCLLEQNPRRKEEDTLMKVTQWMPYECGTDISTERALQNILDYLDYNETDTLQADTQIIIAPGYEFHIVKAIITNFHQPQSTLLLLVSALVGDDWRKIYDYALRNDFRFLSYGDSSLLVP